MVPTPQSRRWPFRAALLTVLATAAHTPLAAQDTTRAPVPAVRVPPPLPRPWRFGVEVGFTDISGNRRLQVFNGVFTSEHQRTTEYIFNSRVEARYGKSDGVVAVSNAAWRLRFDYRPRTAVSPFLGLDFESDRIRKIDARVAIGAGANVNIAPREDRHTTIAVGFILERVNYWADVEKRDSRYHLRFSTLQPLTAQVALETNAKLQPATRDVSDYLVSADASVRVTISRRLAFRTRYEWKRDTTPAAGVLSKDDRSLTASLLITW